MENTSFLGAPGAAGATLAGILAKDGAEGAEGAEGAGTAGIRGGEGAAFRGCDAVRTGGCVARGAAAWRGLLCVAGIVQSLAPFGMRHVKQGARTGAPCSRRPVAYNLI